MKMSVDERLFFFGLDGHVPKIETQKRFDQVVVVMMLITTATTMRGSCCITKRKKGGRTSSSSIMSLSPSYHFKYFKVRVGWSMGSATPSLSLLIVIHLGIP